MAVVNATVHSVETIKGNDRDPLQFAAVYFFLPTSATYAQADNAILSAVATLIGNSRRNGKTIALKTVSLWQASRKEAAPARFMALKTVAIAGADVTFEVTESATDNAIDYATELANGAVPAQSVPFGILVGFEES